jgi:hypothetical protein
VALSKIGEKKYGQMLRALPVIDLDKAVLGKENPYWRKWIEHPVDDDWWAQADFLNKLRDVNIPAFHQSGWFDGDGIGTKLNYLQMKEYGHANQKLTIGPWGHTDTASRKLGDRDFGPQAIIDLQRDYLRWFDYWLKGVDNGITKEPLVSIYVMGTNQWLHGNSYPLPETKFRKLYFSGAGKANTSKGDGRLTFDEPPAGAHPDKYLYDPGDPTPDPNFFETTEEQDKEVRSADEKKTEAEAHHDKVTSARQDILVYQTGVSNGNPARATDFRRPGFGYHLRVFLGARHRLVRHAGGNREGRQDLHPGHRQAARAVPQQRAQTGTAQARPDLRIPARPLADRHHGPGRRPAAGRGRIGGLSDVLAQPEHGRA